MQTELIQEQAGERRFAIVFEKGEEVLDGLRRFAEEQGIDGANFTAVGAFREATLAWWNWDTKEYEDHPVDGQAEVASLVGNVSLAPDGGRKVHAHCVLGLPDTTARAGHLRRGHVRPTLEVFLTETSTPLRREHDPETGLALMKPS